LVRAVHPTLLSRDVALNILLDAGHLKEGDDVIEVSLSGAILSTKL
jgi:hypothetical protein